MHSRKILTNITQCLRDATSAIRFTSRLCCFCTYGVSLRKTDLKWEHPLITYRLSTNDVGRVVGLAEPMGNPYSTQGEPFKGAPPQDGDVVFGKSSKFSNQILPSKHHLICLKPPLLKCRSHRLCRCTAVVAMPHLGTHLRRHFF